MGQFLLLKFPQLSPMSTTRGSHAFTQGATRHSKAGNANIPFAFQLTNPGPNKFLLLNNDGYAQYTDFISVAQFPTPECPSGVAKYHNENGSVDELRFTPMRFDANGSPIRTLACHMPSGQKFRFDIVVGSDGGVKEFVMHCGPGDLAHFERSDLHPSEDEWSETTIDDDLYTTDGVTILEMDF